MRAHVGLARSCYSCTKLTDACKQNVQQKIDENRATVFARAAERAERDRRVAQRLAIAQLADAKHDRARRAGAEGRCAAE